MTTIDYILFLAIIIIAFIVIRILQDRAKTFLGKNMAGYIVLVFVYAAMSYIADNTLKNFLIGLFAIFCGAGLGFYLQYRRAKKINKK